MRSSVLSELVKKIKITVERFGRLMTSKEKRVLKISYYNWFEKAQKGELNYHLRDKWRQSDEFMKQTIHLLDYFGFTRHQYSNKLVIDLGAGSRLRTKYFIGAKIVAIEPLAEKFIQDIPWCDLTDSIEVYSLPAEKYIERCRGVADLLISINVLDHCYDLEKIIKNIYLYLNDTGVAFLSFDRHDFSDEMHPLLLDEPTCEDLFIRNGFEIKSYSKGANGILMTYGHGPYCMNYTLVRKNKK